MFILERLLGWVSAHYHMAMQVFQQHRVSPLMGMALWVGFFVLSIASYFLILRVFLGFGSSVMLDSIFVYTLVLLSFVWGLLLLFARLRLEHKPEAQEFCVQVRCFGLVLRQRCMSGVSAVWLSTAPPVAGGDGETGYRLYGRFDDGTERMLIAPFVAQLFGVRPRSRMGFLLAD